MVAPLTWLSIKHYFLNIQTIINTTTISFNFLRENMDSKPEEVKSTQDLNKETEGNTKV